MKLLTDNLKAISALCQKHKVKSLHAFGSVLTSKFNDKSDIDLLVEFGGVQIENYADNYFDLKFALEALLEREIDLLESQAVKNPFLKEALNKTKEPIYGIAS